MNRPASIVCLVAAVPSLLGMGAAQNNDADNELQRVTGLSTLPASAPNSGIVAVTWDLTTEGATPPLVGPVSAKAITRFDIQITPDK